MNDYPKQSGMNKKEWKRDVRKRWVQLRKTMNNGDSAVRIGCAYYPTEVKDWIDQFEKMDELMKEFYKDA